MKIKIIIELESEIPNETILKSYYDKTSKNDFEKFKQDVIEDLKDEWDKVNIINFTVEDVDTSKFKTNKPIK